MKTIDITPKWEHLLPLMLDAIENGPEAARASVKTELARMAKAADRLNKLLSLLMELSDCRAGDRALIHAISEASK